jgi:mannosyl-glycoprotein endo-beta-N-acetylglucosaminidase
MKKLLNVIKIVTITALFLCMSSLAFATGTDFKELPFQSDKSINKPWTVKFNLELDGNTINSTNVLVKNSSGKEMKTTISLGKDNKSLIIYPPVGGYIPGTTYSVELSTAVKSKNGNNLSNPTKMNFTTLKVYEDATSYAGLPTIKAIDVLEKPVLQNSKTSFNITPNYSGDVQYRIFAFKYPDETFDNPNTYITQTYTELTKGYTTAVSAANSYTFLKTDGFELGKYKIMVYVKTKGTVGKNKDANTDYDNYYSTYFRVLSNNILESNLSSTASTDSTMIPTIAYVSYDKSLEEAALDQLNGAPTYSEGNSWMTPSKELIKYYMNPNNFLDNTYKYKFLNLNYMEGVTEADLNNILNGKGVLNGKGAVFLKAAKDSNINPVYLVSHALLETGNGTSKLSNGILVDSVNGVKVAEPKTTYNMFGIKAFDYDPNRCGSEYAYTQGWFSIDQAIIGGAKFVSTDYINSEKYKQNTLYKMKWNITVRWHQYATDTGWARKQLAKVKFEELMAQITSAKPVFEIPKFK